MTSFGRLIGILLAVGASVALTGVVGVPFVLEVEIILLAFVFSAVVGVIFGYVPARRASRLDPIEALRHE